MSKAKHTSEQFAPAPWDWTPSGSPSGNGDFNLYITDKNGRKIAAVYGRRGEKEKTCNLIAAAPEMLEALKDWIDWLTPGHPWRDDAADHERRMLDAMRAAIAKATAP